MTAAGDLVRFDLNNPAGGATVVFSGQQVLAAQALASGQVVVALANGIVDILDPQGNGLSVASELLPKGETPALPSAIEVVDKPERALRRPGQQPGLRHHLLSSPWEVPCRRQLRHPWVARRRLPSARSNPPSVTATQAFVS